MIVCHCEVVSDREVQAAIAAGARDLDQLSEGCGVADACGGCIPAVEDLLADAALATHDVGALLADQAARRVPVAA